MVCSIRVFRQTYFNQNVTCEFTGVNTKLTTLLILYLNLSSKFKTNNMTYHGNHSLFISRSIILELANHREVLISTVCFDVELHPIESHGMVYELLGTRFLCLPTEITGVPPPPRVLPVSLPGTSVARTGPSHGGPANRLQLRHPPSTQGSVTRPRF